MFFREGDDGGGGGGCPVNLREGPPLLGGGVGGCPVNRREGAVDRRAPSEALDPRNMMPALPQTSAPSQRVDLSKVRETSSIPKSDAAENWVYPSPQQFYHALLRKEKDPEAESIEDVVRVHNQTNEETWRHVLAWEQLHASTCATPTLLRFTGRPFDLSWGAWCSQTLSYRGKPFDRHDWYVDRCGQKTVRYVIDYYDDPRAGNELEITIEARPAIDSAGALMDRLRRPLWQARRVWAALFGGGSPDAR